jgi:hypothetical protein
MSDNNDTGQFVTIREYMGLQLEPIRLELSQLRAVIEKMSTGMVTSIQYDQLRMQTGQLSEAVQELENRLKTLEQHDSVSVWVFRLVAGVGTALLIAWLSGVIKP